MSRFLKFGAAAIAFVVLAAAAFYAWASFRSSATLARTIEVHQDDFPIPFPLDSAEIAEAGLTTADAEQMALARAVERGRHLVESRYACSDCHGGDFGGGVMVDAFPIGSLLGPNITTGAGSRTLGYTAADWDGIVRHGVRADGRPAVMPSTEFRNMSDQELSDIVSYIRAQPPVDATVEPPVFGPLGRILLATGQFPLSADRLASGTEHMAVPPAAEVSLEFGAHLASPCTGCHGPALSGGPIPGGDPSWAPAANLTPAEDGLAGWTFDDFERVMREGMSPDGVALQTPMPLALPYTRNLTEVELEALWLYLTSLDPMPTGAR